MIIKLHIDLFRMNSECKKQNLVKMTHFHLDVFTRNLKLERLEARDQIELLKTEIQILKDTWLRGLHQLSIQTHKIAH